MSDALQPAAASTDTGPWFEDRVTDPAWVGSEPDDAELEMVDGATTVVFPGDTGTLAYPQRLVLHALMKHRFVTRARAHNSDSSRARTLDDGAWRVLLDSEALLRERLHDLFLDLHLDRVRGVAYKRPVTTETGGRFPTLLHDVAWNREQTALLVYLRTYLRRHQVDDSTDTVIVDVEDMQEHVATLRPADATNLSGGAKRTSNAIEYLVTTGVLVKTADPNRFAVDPVLEALLPLSTLHALLEHLQDPTAAGEEAPADGDTGTPAGPPTRSDTPSSDTGTDTADAQEGSP